MDNSDKKQSSLRGPGRPPSPPGVSRRHRVVTFVNDAEYEQLLNAAEQHGETLSKVVYKALQCGLPNEQ